MPKTVRRTGAVLVLAMTSLSACTGSGTSSPATTPAVGAAPTVPAPLAALDEPDTGRVIAHAVDRTGGWRSTVGTSADTGPLDISATCTGGGRIDITYGVGSPDGSRTQAPCDGSTMHNRDASAASGTVTLTIGSTGDKRWSLLVVRGMQLD